MNLAARDPRGPTGFEICLSCDERRDIEPRRGPKLGNSFVDNHLRNYDSCNRSALCNSAQRAVFVSRTLSTCFRQTPM